MGTVFISVITRRIYNSVSLVSLDIHQQQLYVNDVHKQPISSNIKSIRLLKFGRRLGTLTIMTRGQREALYMSAAFMLHSVKEAIASPIRTHRSAF